MVVGSSSDPAEREADAAARVIVARLRADDGGASAESGGGRIQRSAFTETSPAGAPVDRIRPATAAAAQRQMIRRAYVNGTAAKDAPLFEKVSPVDAAIPLGDGSTANGLGITQINMKHYLERHTYKYQRLNSKTISPAAGMFPQGTTVDNVKALLVKALAKVPSGTAIGESAVSTTVEVDGLKLNLGALKGGKLSAFFPIDGTGYHKYSADELKAIRGEKNAGSTS